MRFNLHNFDATECYNVSKEKIILILNLIVNEKFNIQNYMRIMAIR